MRLSGFRDFAAINGFTSQNQNSRLCCDAHSSPQLNEGDLIRLIGELATALELAGDIDPAN